MSGVLRYRKNADIQISNHTLRNGSRCLTIELWHNEGAGVILFYPGSMMSPYQYRAMLAALHESGFAVAALHLTGHGVNPHTSSFTFDDLLHDGLDAEQWLRSQGHTSIAVCGHSQGGILTLAHAAASKTLTAAFPICGVLPQQDESIDLTIFSRYAKKRVRLIANINFFASRIPWLPLPLSAYISPHRLLAGRLKTVSSGRKLGWTYPLGHLASLFTTHISEDMHCPVCLFNADDDAVFTPEQIKITFDLLRAPNKRLVWLHGGGHTAVMHPPHCRFMARTAASICAGLKLSLRINFPQTVK